MTHIPTIAMSRKIVDILSMVCTLGGKRVNQSQID